MQNLITVVIPTYNRPQEIARQLNFLAEFPHIFTVLVLDGSSDEFLKKNHELCLSFSNVEYHKFPSDLHLGMRLKSGLQLVKTPYVLMCGDDDFFFPEAVVESINFLEKNPDYAAAIGKVWSLVYFPDKQFISNGIAITDELDFGSRFNHERFIQRVLYYFAYTAIGSIPLFYAVRRTDQVLKAFELMTPEIKYSSMELLIVGMSLIDGKVAKLPVAFGLRDYGAVTTRDLEREGVDLYIPLEDASYIRPLLVEALMIKEGLDRKLAEYLIDSVLLLWEKTPPTPDLPLLPLWRSRMRSLKYYLICLASKMAPKLMANILGIPVDVYSALLKVHGRFTASRK